MAARHEGDKGGVLKAIPSPEIMWKHFQDYRQWAKENPVEKHVFVGKDGDSAFQKIERPLTYEEFCDYLEDNGIIKDPIHYFMNYEGRYEMFVSVCSRIKRVIRGNQIVGGLAGIYNPSITQRLNGLTEKVEVKEPEDTIPYDELSETTLNEIAEAIKAKSVQSAGRAGKA